MVRRLAMGTVESVAMGHCRMCATAVESHVVVERLFRVMICPLKDEAEWVEHRQGQRKGLHQSGHWPAPPPTVNDVFILSRDGRRLNSSWRSPKLQ